MAGKSRNIILGVCGSIAAYKSADIIRRLQDKDVAVRVVMTKTAEEFITPLTLSALSGQNVLRGMFDENSWSMAHLQLVKESDGLLIAPATANFIGKLACGLADDLLSTLALTYKKHIWVAPAMNDDMYASAIVAENCLRLKNRGYNFIEPIKGKLACGVTGIGHLAEVDDIVAAVLK